MRKIIYLIPLIIISLVNNPGYSQINYTVLDPEITITIPDSIGVNYYEINLDSDTSVDFRIGVRYKEIMGWSKSFSDFNYVYIESLNENKINGGPYFDGELISSSINFYISNWIYGYGKEYGGYIGTWPTSIASVDTFAYVVLQFNQNNNIHYGWIRLKTNGESFTVDSYGWNQNPNQPILAGQSY